MQSNVEHSTFKIIAKCFLRNVYSLNLLNFFNPSSLALTKPTKHMNQEQYIKGKSINLIFYFTRPLLGKFSIQ